jgi:hypothetical protein
MKALGRYSAAGLLVVLGTVAVSWPLLDETGRRSLLTAAGIVGPVQLALFAILAAAMGDTKQFLLSWGAGLLGRAGVVALVALGLGGAQRYDATVLVLSTTGLFLVLLLLEPVFLANPDPFTAEVS